MSSRRARNAQPVRASLQQTEDHEIADDQPEEDVVGRYALAQDRVAGGLDAEAGVTAEEVAATEQQAVEGERERQRDDADEDRAERA